jgi:hypothetical protein
MEKPTMKNHFQLSILLTCLGTLSTSLLVFTPASRADICNSRYGTGGYSDRIGHANCRKNQSWEKDLRSIPEEVERHFRSWNNNTNKNPSYRSTPNYQSVPNVVPRTAEEQEIEIISQKETEYCRKAGGSFEECNQERVLR